MKVFYPCFMDGKLRSREVEKNDSMSDDELMAGQELKLTSSDLHLSPLLSQTTWPCDGKMERSYQWQDKDIYIKTVELVPQWKFLHLDKRWFAHAISPSCLLGGGSAAGVAAFSGGHCHCHRSALMLLFPSLDVGASCRSPSGWT